MATGVTGGGIVAMQNLRFSHAADNSRPFKSHRYDVYGVKIQRNLFLYGELALSGFVALEADSEVIAYCERPIVIEEISPRRVVDFWVRRDGGEEVWFLLRPTEYKWLDQEHAPTPAFCLWAKSKGLHVHLKSSEALGVGSLGLRNWGEIVRHLSANLKYLDDALLKRVSDHCQQASSLASIQNAFSQEDPIQIRTAVFRLLHSGTLVGSNIGETRLGSESMVAPA